MLTLNDELWPNGIKKDNQGYAVFYPIGTNKTPIPVASSDWPTGDKLISPFVFQNDELVGFIDTKAMTVSGNTTITMPYTHIEADFSSIEEGTLTVNAPNATVKKFKWAVSTSGDESFDFDFVIIDFTTTDQETINTVRTAKRVVNNKLYDVEDNLIGTWDSSKIEVGGTYDLETDITDGLFCNFDNMDMYGGNERGLVLSEFNSNLSSLRDGTGMFAGCSQLTTFTSNLSSLTIGQEMFERCSNLTTFTSNLSSLTDSYEMFFNCTALTTFSSDLSSLMYGNYMFEECEFLTSFTSDLSSLTDGRMMFDGCSSLTSFTSNLSSLIGGYCMFSGCKLDAASVKSIIDTINTYSGESGLDPGVLRLGMGCDDNTADKDLFAQEVGYTDMASLLAALQAKGWTVTAQYNGRPTSTYSMRRTTEPTLPVFVKLEEVEESSDKLKSFHTHISFDGTKKYRLNWFHETSGTTDGYTQFNSLEEAIEHFNIKQVERN